MGQNLFARIVKRWFGQCSRADLTHAYTVAETLAFERYRAIIAGGESKQGAR